MLVAWPDGRNINDIDIKDYRDMKTFSFYWNWLARVTKSNSVQRKAVVKSATSQSPISGKTAIFAVTTIIAVALTTQTTEPSMQSAETPTLPDLPLPGFMPEPSLPPFPPGAFDSCAEQYDSRLSTIDQSYNSMLKAFQRTRDAKLKIVQDLIDAIWDEIDNHRKKSETFGTDGQKYIWRRAITMRPEKHWIG